MSMDPESSKSTTNRLDKPQIVITEKDYQTALAKINMDDLSDVEDTGFEHEREQYLARSFDRTTVVKEVESKKRKVRS